MGLLLGLSGRCGTRCRGFRHDSSSLTSPRWPAATLPASLPQPPPPTQSPHCRLSYCLPPLSHSSAGTVMGNVNMTPQPYACSPELTLLLQIPPLSPALPGSLCLGRATLSGSFLSTFTLGKDPAAPWHSPPGTSPAPAQTSVHGTTGCKPRSPAKGGLAIGTHPSICQVNE